MGPRESAGPSTVSRPTRRRFLVGAAGVGALLTGHRLLDPGLAKVWARRPRSALSKAETETLVAWCDLLAPGARTAGVGDFVNAQLRKPHEEALLMLRFLWPPPYDRFYKTGIAALDRASVAAFRRRFVRLGRARQRVLLNRILADKVPWKGPPAPLFHLATRGDAVDVVYGTPKGFTRLDFPYMALVKPPARW